MQVEVYKDAHSLKQILCYSSAPQAIAVTEEMVDYLCIESKEISLLTASGGSIREIVDLLKIEETLLTPHQRIILLVRTSESNPLSVVDLSQISALLGQFPKDADICWGMATAKELDNITLFIAMTQ